MATLEQLKEARKKAVLSPNVGKHGKAKKTIEKERRRAIFDEEISKRWNKTISDLPATYVADQFMGKAPDVIIVDPKLLELLDKANKILPK